MASPERWVFYQHRPTGSVLRVVEKRNDRMLIVTGDGEKRLSPQASRLLLYFLQHASQSLTDKELDAAVWDDRNEHQLTQPLNALKGAFGDDEGHLIRTVQIRPVRYQFLRDPNDLIEKPGSPQIKLTTLHDLAQSRTGGAVVNPIRLLDARVSPLPFVGRNEDSDELWKWVTDPGPVSLKVLGGPGGRGKTRLAIHVLERLQKERSGEWHAGFLEHGIDEVLRCTDFREWQPNKRTLIIIDDAARWSEKIAEFIIGKISEGVNDRYPRRFLLIERSAHSRFEWYRRLLDASRNRPGRLPIMAEPLNLRPLHVESEFRSRERRELLDNAFDALHKIDGKPKLVIDNAADVALAGPDMGDPLTILMAAIVAHDRQDLAPLTYRRLILADELVGRERERIDNLTTSPLLVFHMSAYVTLTRGLNREDLTMSCAEEKKAIDPDSGWSVAELKAVIAQKALPSSASPFDAAPIVPDIVGEVFIESVFLSPEHQPAETVARSFRRHPNAVTTTILNMVMDFVQDAQNSKVFVPRESAVLAWVEAVLDRLAPDLNTVGTKEMLGYRTPPALLLVEELARIKPSVFAPYLARSRRDWGKALLSAGEQGAAFHQFEDGLRKIKPLALTGSENYWHLASTLAVEYAQLPSVNEYLLCPFLIGTYPRDPNLLREYVRLVPATRLTQHIKMLSELAANAEEGSSPRLMLPDLRARYEALSDGIPHIAAVEEAVRLERQAAFWADASFMEEALGSAERAITAIERLRHIDRSEYLPLLASCYAIIADTQSKLFKSVESLDAISKAIELYRELTVSDSQKNRSSLALALLKLSILKLPVRSLETLEMLREATTYYVDIERSTESSISTHCVSSTLYDLRVLMLWEMGDKQAALELLRQKCIENSHVIGCGTMIRDQYVPYVAGASRQRILPKSAESYWELVLDHDDPYGIAWQYLLGKRIEAEYAVEICNDAWTGQMFLTAAIDNCAILVARNPSRFQHHLNDWTELKQQWLVRYGQTSAPETAHLSKPVLDAIVKTLREVHAMADDHQRQKWRPRDVSNPPSQS